MNPALPDPAVLVAQLAAQGIVLPPGPVHVDGYGDSEALSEELLALIVSGRKRAGTGLLWAMQADGDAVPEAGAIELVVDHAHRLRLVTRLTRVAVLPYDAVDAAYAAREGEGDGSLAYWRRAHDAFFGRECARIGREPAPDMPVVCCEFELLHVLPLA